MNCIINKKALFAYPDALLLAAERPQERHQDEEREEGRLKDQQICKESSLMKGSPVKRQRTYYPVLP